MDSDSSSPKLAFEIPFLFKAFEDGSIQRLAGTETVPPSLESEIQSKDVVVSSQLNLSSRLYLPKSLHKKVPLLLYFHGGGFCLHNAFSPLYHPYLTKLAKDANVLIVSVDYRKAPENPLPAAYDDAWTALNWIASHSNGDGPEDWVNRYADLGRVYFAGDSAGANIAHNLAMRFGIEKLKLKLKSGDVNVAGIVLVHPFFWGKEAIDGETEDPRKRWVGDGLWNLAYPNPIGGLDSPDINPGLDPNLSKLGCKRVLIFVAEKDDLSRRGWYYYESLKKSGWEGSLEIIESKDEDHVFHISAKPSCDNALALMKKFVSFLNQSD